MVDVEEMTLVDAANLIQQTVGRDLSVKDLKTMNTCLVRSSKIWSGVIDGELVCVWGLCPPSLLSAHAYLWLYTTDKVKNHEFLFVRHSQLVVEKMLEEYEMIVGVANASDTKAIRWLKWLGAVFEPFQDGLLRFSIWRKHG